METVLKIGTVSVFWYRLEIEIVFSTNLSVIAEEIAVFLKQRIAHFVNLGKGTDR